MLYLDSSVLIKRYLRERGSKTLQTRFYTGERIFTSVYSYAEIHTVFGRKYLQKELTQSGYKAVQERFVQDWLFSLNPLELDEKTLADLPGLVKRYPLKAADAVHLSSAVWLRHMCRLVPSFVAGDQQLEFAVSDKQLAKYARHCGLHVFDPEETE